VVYPGEQGSLSHLASTQFFKNVPNTCLAGVGSFKKVFESVASGSAMYGVIPLENSTSGTLHSMYDLLVAYDSLSIGGELGVRETYCLCAQQGVALTDVNRVLSHPAILQACSDFVETRLRGSLDGSESDVEVLPMWSTSAAVRQVASERGTADSKSTAAIATREAAAYHDLPVLAEDIGNDTFLETRYIVIHRRSDERPPPFRHELVSGATTKRSACFALPNEPAAAFKLLSCWALRGISVVKLETRPVSSGRNAPPGLPPGTARLWDYLFYVDYTVPPGQTKEEESKLWESVSEFSLWQRDLGTYPSQVSHNTEKKQQNWTEMVDIMAKA